MSGGGGGWGGGRGEAGGTPPAARDRGTTGRLELGRGSLDRVGGN
jgi:hypothetical protein